MHAIFASTHRDRERNHPLLRYSGKYYTPAYGVCTHAVYTKLQNFCPFVGPTLFINEMEIPEI